MEHLGRGDPAIIFPCGLHRSGTTLLARILGQSRSISGLNNTTAPYDEGQFLQEIYPVDRTFGGPGRFGFAAEAHMTESAVRSLSVERAALFMAWRPFWDLSRPFLLQKTPSDLLKMRYLQKLFPQARFIILIRHPIAVSLATQKWSQTSPFALIEHWLHCHELVVGDLPYLSAAIVVRYETLMSQPRQTARLITDFLGIEPIDPGERPDPGINQVYLRAWARCLPTGSTCAGRTVVRPNERRQRLERILQRITGRLGLDIVRRENEYASGVERFEETVRRYGYSLIDPAFEPDGSHQLGHGQVVGGGAERHG